MIFFREMLVINEKILPGVQNSLLKRERGSLYLISTHRQWITVFSLQIRAAFKDIMSISCLFFFFFFFSSTRGPGALWVDSS